MHQFFLSYGHSDQNIADELRKQLMRAFPDDLTFFISGWDILPGDRWKQSLKASLDGSEAIILLLTPEYMKRPWAHVEWTPFWLSDRKAYVLTTPGVNTAELASPMRDDQMAELFNASDVRALITAIGKQLGVEPQEPDTIAPALALRAEQLFNDLLAERARTQFGIYREAPELLPRDDKKKEEVFWHFLDREPDETMQRTVFSRMDDAAVQGTILNVLVDKGRYDVAGHLAEFVSNKDYLLPAMRALVQRGLVDSEIFKRLLDSIRGSNIAVKKFSEYLSDYSSASHPLLEELIELQQNNAELRNNGKHLVDQGLDRTPLFERLFELLAERSATETRNLLLYVIDKKVYDESRMRSFLLVLAARSAKELRNAWRHLERKDPALAAVMAKELREKGYVLDRED